MKETIDISFVVTFYNEGKNVEILHRRLKAVAEDLEHTYEIIFVDDGSTDDTFALMERVHEVDPTVKVIQLARNYGQTAGLSAGIDHAGGDTIVCLDGDLQHAPEDIPRLLDKMAEGYDIVSGWREDRRDALLSRKLPSRVANWIMGKLSGVSIHDFGTTLKAYRRDVIKNIRLYGEHHRFIPALASQMGVRITEVEITNPPRRHGRSKYNLMRTKRVFLDLLTVKFLISFFTRPMQLFGFFGVILEVIGIGSVAYLMVDKLVFQHEWSGRAGPLLAIFFILLGFQFLTIGLLGEMITRVYYEAVGKPTYTVRAVLDRREGEHGREDPS